MPATGIAAALTIARPSARLGRPRRSEPSEPSHARCVRAAPARGHRRRRPGPRAARHGSTRPGLGRRAGARCAALVKVLDMGLFTAFDRPFDPVDDWSYTGIGIETLRDSVGPTGREPGRRRRGAARRRRARPPDPGGASPDPGRGRPPPRGRSRPSRRSAPSGCSAGRSGRSSSPARRSPRRAPPTWPSTRYARCAPASRIARLRRRDPPRPLPLTPRRPAADRPARQGRHRRVRRELREGRGRGFVFLAARRRRARRRGRSGCGPPASPRGAAGSPRPRSAASAGWRTPRCIRGSGSTGNGATTSSSRATASRSARRSSAPGGGPSTIVPANDRDWPEGSSFYGYDEVYDQRNLGYRGPRYAFAPMPDQYVLLALQRLELAKRDRRPLFAEVDMVSSHAPWTRIPRADRLGRRRQRLGLQPPAGRQ